jgi:hypothetical protein
MHIEMVVSLENGWSVRDVKNFKETVEKKEERKATWPCKWMRGSDDECEDLRWKRHEIDRE